eukprot:2396454-Rhodomonas_salina.1
MALHLELLLFRVVIDVTLVVAEPLLAVLLSDVDVERHDAVCVLLVDFQENAHLDALSDLPVHKFRVLIARAVVGQVAFRGLALQLVPLDAVSVEDNREDKGV